VTEWERTLGIILVFLFCYIGLLRFEDKKLQIICFFTAIASAITLAGWTEGMISNMQQIIKRIPEIKPDTIGAAASTISLGLSPIIPVKSLRRATQTTAASGLILSMLGIPIWVMWIILAIIGVSCFLAIYYLLKRVSKWITSPTKGGT